MRELIKDPFYELVEKVEDKSEIPSGFVVLTDIAPDVIVEMRYYSEYNFVGKRIRGYEEPVALVTRETALALKKASEDVALRGYRLKIWDAYRPQTAVDHFIEWAKDFSDVKMQQYFYPDQEKANLFVYGFIASRSSHSRGSAVDVTLYDVRNGYDVDMGGTFDYFGERSYPDYPDLTEQQKMHRDFLRIVMNKYGLKGISTEWWHFILVDEPYPNRYFNFPVKRP